MLKLGLNYMPCFTPNETRSFCLGGCFSPFCMLKANKQANKTMHFNYIFTQNIILGLQFKIPICISKHIPKNSNTPNPKLTIRSCLPSSFDPPASRQCWLQTKLMNSCGHLKLSVFSTNSLHSQQDVPISALPGSVVNSPKTFRISLYWRTCVFSFGSRGFSSQWNQQLSIGPGDASTWGWSQAASILSILY